ncbi:ABC transporter permease, partial [bacterium]|nr:ABC transporter permease [bacterium]
TAKKYFGDENPVGKVIQMDNRYSVKVAGVLAPAEKPSHIKADLLISFPTFTAVTPNYNVHSWGSVSYFTYVKLAEHASAVELENKISTLIEKRLGKATSERIFYKLQPVRDIYLHSEGLQGCIGPLGSLSHVYTLSIVGFLILAISAFNFTNLAIARAGKRSKEIGLRKVLGSERRQLIGQFLSESALMTTFSLIVSWAIVEFFGEILASALGVPLTLTVADRLITAGLFFIVALIIGITAGLYPAIVMSGFQTISILKGTFKSGKAGIQVRKALVVTQFVMSVVLIIGTMVVYKQMEFTRAKNLGFEQEHTIVLPMRGAQLMQQYETLKETLLHNPDVLGVTASRNGLDGGYGGYSVVPEGGDPNQPVRVLLYPVNYDFFETLGMDLIEGRSFSKNFPTDEQGSVIINRTAMERFGWKTAQGQKLDLPHIPNTKGNVIGVVDDFHFTSLHETIGPLLLFLMPHRNDFVFVKFRSGDPTPMIASVEATWNKLLPNYPFEYTFLDERIRGIYEADQRFAQLTTIFSVLAIIIACLGLFGLAAFSAQQRTKEIGIRKVLGANIRNILQLLAGEFMLLIFAANIIAWPAGYYAMNEWLKDFAYRAEMGWGVFVLATGVTLVIALATVCMQALKAAIANPVEALKYE